MRMLVSAAAVVLLCASPAAAKKPMPVFQPTPFSLLAPDVFWEARDMASLPKWLRARDWILADVAETRSPSVGAWARWAESLRSLPRDSLLADVHHEVNSRISYAADGVDYWQTPAETIERGQGDCEDYAILEFWLLRLAGLPATQLAVVFGLIDTDAWHAALLADRMVLDNRRQTVISASDFATGFQLKAAVSLAYVIAEFRLKQIEVMPK